MQRGLYVGKRELCDQIQKCRKNWMAECSRWLKHRLDRGMYGEQAGSAVGVRLWMV